MCTVPQLFDVSLQSRVAFITSCYLLEFLSVCILEICENMHFKLSIRHKSSWLVRGHYMYKNEEFLRLSIQEY